MGLRIGIDSGGTFTDVMAVTDSGDIKILKIPATPERPSAPFLEGVRSFGGDGLSIDAVLHGTTVAINALLQHEVPTIGLVVTRGFRDVLEIARQTVPGERGSIYVWRKPESVVPLERVFEVSGRLDARGNEITPLDVAEVRNLAAKLREQRITTVAVSLLNSYANPDHEIALREVLSAAYPECRVVLSTETLAEFREYERTMTTCMNALLVPSLSAYLAELVEGLLEMRVNSPLYIMKSAGGVVRSEIAVRQPLYTALSGPAAAVLGMAWLGREAGFSDLITFDMGGTSTDVSVVEGGRPALTNTGTLGAYPISAPAIDVVSIGSGGGSIAWVGEGGRIGVGPRSAGASPGPACYGKGGTEATVTDAHLLLGRLPPALIDGGLVLDAEGATAAVERFAGVVGMRPIDAAYGILEIANFRMSDAIRRVTVRLGRAPQDFTLVAAGGAGPLHAVELARLLDIRTIVIPPNPGMGCALGLLEADIKDDFVVTEIQSQRSIDLGRLNERFARLDEKADQSLEQQGVAGPDRAILRFADLRYEGMATELTVPVDGGPIDGSTLGRLWDRFHVAHRDAYGYDYRGQQPVEVVNLRVSAIGRLPHLKLPAIERDGSDPGEAVVGSRRVYFPGHGYVDCPRYERKRLRAGNRFAGPAVVDQYDATTIVGPDDRVQVDRVGNLVISACADGSK